MFEMWEDIVCVGWMEVEKKACEMEDVYLPAENSAFQFKF
jgi:hypothetical protein